MGYSAAGEAEFCVLGGSRWARRSCCAHIKIPLGFGLCDGSLDSLDRKHKFTAHTFNKWGA